MDTAAKSFEHYLGMLQSADSLEQERGFQELRTRTAEHIHEIVALFEESRDSPFRDYLFILLLESDLPQAQPILQAVEHGHHERLRQLYAGFGRRDDLRPPAIEADTDSGPILRLRRKVATIAGFPVYLHISLLIWTPFLLVGGTSWAVFGILFASVLIHELAHAVSCRLLGLGGGSVTLWFYGGLFFPTRMRQMPHQMASMDRLRFVGMIAAGPVSNLVLATAAQLVWLLTDAEWARQATDINLTLAIFNLIPMPPLDGEKIVVGLGLTWFRRRWIYAGLSVLLVALSVGGFYAGFVLDWPHDYVRFAPYTLIGAIQAIRLTLQTDADLTKQERTYARALTREREFIGEPMDRR